MIAHKNGQIKVSKNVIFCNGKDSMFNPRINSKMDFLIGQLSIKHGLKISAFAIQHIDQAIPFADICSFL